VHMWDGDGFGSIDDDDGHKASLEVVSVDEKTRNGNCNTCLVSSAPGDIPWSVYSAWRCVTTLD
jgi:hypothetical protein